MSVRIRKRRGIPWAQVPRIVIEDPKLSWKAKGLYAYLVSRPDEWEVRRKDLIRRSTDGSTSLDSGVRELQDAGLLVIQTSHDSDGKFVGTEWLVEWPETRVPENADTDNANLSREVGKPYRDDSKTSSSDPSDPTLALPGLEPSENGAPPPTASKEEFEKLWAVCRRGPKQKAWEQYRKAVPKKVSAEEIAKAWRRIVAASEEAQFVPHFFRWIRDERWDEELPEAEPEAGSEEWMEREYERIVNL